MKRFILMIVILVFFATAGGVFLYYKNSNLKPINVSADILKTNPVPSPSINYPKVETWQVPILMYHYIRNAENESQLGKNLSVSPQSFSEQLDWLKNNNFETVNMKDISDPEKTAMSKIAYDKKKPIVLTFDDGYLDAYTNAYSILKEHNMTATFYIIRDYVGSSEYMTQSQIDELKNSGFEIGSHTLSHPDLTKTDLVDAQEQITNSKLSATSFCYPSGRYDATTIKLVKDAGYETAVTTKFGIADNNLNLLELPRVRVENTSGEALYNKITVAMGQD